MINHVSITHVFNGDAGARNAINAAQLDTQLGNLAAAHNTVVDSVLSLASGHVITEGSGDASARVDTIAALRTLNTFPSVVDVSGYYSIGDGGGGLFRWDSTATGVTDNGGTIILPVSGASGAWRRIHSGVLYVRWFGAKGDGIADDRAAIQAADVAASDYFNSLGGSAWAPGGGTGGDNAKSVSSVVLIFSAGAYAISASITKQSGVIWLGQGGQIRPINSASATGALFSLVKGSSLALFGFKDMEFLGIGVDLKISNSRTDSSALGGCDTAIDLDSCTDGFIDGCRIYRTNDGIKLRRCGRIQILSCKIHSRSLKTLASLDNGTFVPYTLTGSRGGGIQIVAYTGITDIAPCYDILIGLNDIECVGLDQGIDLGSQGNETHRIQAIGNYIRGPNCGIQTYVSGGAVPDDGSATTTYRGTSIIDNRIRLTYEQGIYIRGVGGVLCQGNHLERVCIVGIGPSGGSAGGAIVCRAQTKETYPVSAVTHDLGIVIINNYIIDPGNPTTGTCENGIRCDQSNSVVRNNTLIRSANRFGANLIPSANCAAIHCLKLGADSQPDRLELESNKIYGWRHGVFIEFSAPYANRGATAIRIEGNAIANVAYGVFSSTYGSGVRIDSNVVELASIAAFTVTKSPQVILVGNHAADSAIAFSIDSGCLYSDLYGQTTRHGATVIFDDNRADNCTTALAMPSTASGDTAIWNRVKFFGKFTVNGRDFDGSLSYGTSAVPTSSGSTRAWQLGEVMPNRVPTAGGYIGWVVYIAGTHGTLSSVTATTTAGFPTVTFNTLEGIAPGDTITIVGVSLANIRVISVDPLTLTAVVHANIAETVSAAAVAYQAPGWKGYGLIQA